MSRFLNLLKVVDGLAFRPVAFFTASLSWVGGCRKPSDLVAIIRPGGMGDLICLQMAMEELGLDPNQFFWVIEKRSAAWAEYVGLRNFVCYDRQLFGVVIRLAGRFRSVINSEQFFGLSQAFGCLLRRPGGQLVGFNTNRGARLADACVSYDPYDSHEVTEFSRLLGSFVPNKEECISARREPRPRRKPSDGTRVVCIAGLQSPSRKLDAAVWRRIINEWSPDSEGVQIVSAPIDRAFADELVAMSGVPLIKVDGPFKTVCELLAGAEEVLTLDGGMVHVASYFGIPTTAIFTSGREGKWAPLASRSKVLGVRELQCRPCTLFGQTPVCRNSFECQKIPSLRAAWDTAST